MVVQWLMCKNWEEIGGELDGVQYQMVNLIKLWIGELTKYDP
jgi:hypothetical protein